MKINLTINGKKKSLQIPVNRKLGDLLRALGFWSVKHGCETGNCGNCTVIVEGKAVYSCLMLAAQVHGKNIETFEHIESSDRLARLKEAFMDYVDLDCAYCLPGLLITTKALIDTNPEPTEEELADALCGVLCRCSKKPYPIAEIMEAIAKSRGNW